MDSIFYHYTDFQALDGILHSAQLRVNNVLRMNDSAEMRHFMGRLSSAIVRQLAAEGETEVSETAHIDRGYEDIARDLRRLGAEIVRAED